MDNHLATCLIDLYAKCGAIDKAYDLFHGSRKKDLVAYTAMIIGCGITGRVNDAVRLFEAMVNNQICPNLATFTGLVTVFNQALVDEGYTCFSSMKDHGLFPSCDHYGIMVDLLGRAGKLLEEAYELINSMPMQPNVEVWGALLLASRLHNNVEYGEIAAQHYFKLETDSNAYRSLLANIYASVGRWDDARRLRKHLEKNKLVKIPGCSWMEFA